LNITFSEAITDESRAAFAEMFEFTCVRSGSNQVPEKPVLQSGLGAQMMLVMP
jgi:hypothetical protein